MTTKFTPGQLRVVPNYQSDSEYDVYDDAGNYLKQNMSRDEQDSVARFLEAAPDLYRACEELVALWELEGGHLLKLDSPSIVRARAALKRARGEA